MRLNKMDDDTFILTMNKEDLQDFYDAFTCLYHEYNSMSPSQVEFQELAEPYVEVEE